MSSLHAVACVFGNPIAQSKSPIIHNMFAKQCNLSLDYQKRLAQNDGFIASVEAFFSDESTVGANVTMPFKLDALQWVTTLSSQAKRAGAVNTIIRKNDGFEGDNTDGKGLVADLNYHNINVKNAKILIIGAGGAAKGALPALLDEGAKEVFIYNRSKDKATALVDYTNEYAGNKAKVYDASISDFTIIINATSLSLDGNLPDLPNSIFANKPCVYDMVYQSQPTVFMQHASTLGCDTVIDGLGMLVHQAAYSFYQWFSYMPNCTPVYEYLRGENHHPTQ